MRSQSPDQRRYQYTILDAAENERHKLVCNDQGFPSHLTTQEILAYRDRHGHEAAKWARNEEYRNYYYVREFQEDKRRRENGEQ